eukprot:jgi/Mesvir1/24524/Mv21865-RA.1
MASMLVGSAASAFIMPLVASRAPAAKANIKPASCPSQSRRQLQVSCAQAAATPSFTGDGFAKTLVEDVKMEKTFPECPFTLWGEPITVDSIEKLKKESLKATSKVEAVGSIAKVARVPAPGKRGLIELVRDSCVPAASAATPAEQAAAELQWLKENARSIIDTLKREGVVQMTGFEMAKTPEGSKALVTALGLNPCLDPMHRIAARSVASGKDAVYEAVNKPSRANYTVGMHNEMVGNRTPRLAAFVCFKAAEKGGEFLVLDGAKVFEQLSTSFLARVLGHGGVQFSVMEIPLPFMDKVPKGWPKSVLESVLRWAVETAVRAKVDFDVSYRWGYEGYDGGAMLQGIAQPQPPVIRHPTTGLPVWFCNMHSHSRYLREKRQAVDGELPPTTGASRFNKTDVFYGDGAPVSEEDLEHVDKLTWANIHEIAMKPGSVLLLDNYRVMHGRKVFSGTRKHGVIWIGREGYDF